MYGTNMKNWKPFICATFFVLIVGLFSQAFAQTANAGGRGQGVRTNPEASASEITESSLRSMAADSLETHFFDFDDGSAEGWLASPPSLWSVSNGVLKVEGNGGYEIRYALYDTDFSDATIQVDTRMTQGAIPSFAPAYGIIVRSDDAADDFYEFDISGRGAYSVALFEDGDWYDLVDWKPSSYINKNPGQWNTLKVEASGSAFRFYINGKLVETISDATYSSGKVGVVAWEGDDPEYPIQVEFDNVSIVPDDGGSAAYEYYLPYFLADSNNATGVALKNMNATQSANTRTIVYDSKGNAIDAQNRTIAPRGQAVFLVAQEVGKEGWIQVNSDRKLAGLCFVGTSGNPDFMMDIMLISKLSTTLHVPHVAQNKKWDTTLFVGNPNDNAITVTFAYVDQSGRQLNSIQRNVSANGSVKVDLQTVLGGGAAGSGSVEITGTGPIAGFGLYTDIKSGNYNYSGVAAMTP